MIIPSGVYLISRFIKIWLSQIKISFFFFFFIYAIDITSLYKILYYKVSLMKIILILILSLDQSTQDIKSNSYYSRLLYGNKLILFNINR